MNYLTMRSNSKIREKLFLIALAFIGMVLFSPLAGAQDSTRVTLDSCYQWARANYPAIKQFRLIEQVRDFNVTNAARGLLPQLTINGYFLFLLNLLHAFLLVQNSAEKY